MFNNLLPIFEFESLKTEKQAKAREKYLVLAVSNS
uniref:Uncharacterized protein n=1 Tax=Rhizophora mucronata TaxID=61149 RepID=A0A2P2LK49_RHIMU